MNYDEKKEFFANYKLLNSRIDSLLKQKEEWSEKALLIDKVYPTSKCINRVIELERDIDREIDRLIDLRKYIFSLINTLDEELLKRIIEMKYIEFKPFEKIGEEIGYCEKQVARLHRKALNLIDL